MKTHIRALEILLLLAVSSAPAILLLAQGLPGGSGWEVIADGVRERRLEGGRVERIALGVEGWRWVVDRLEGEAGQWGDLPGALGAPDRPDLDAEVLRLRWALDALDSFVDEYGEEEVAAALAEARASCSFTFETATVAEGGLPSSWIYPFGIRAQATAGWQTGCGAEALVFARTVAEAASPGISSASGEAADLCYQRGTGAACRARVQATGFAPCHADVLSAIAVPELALYFEAEEASSDCASIPSYPNPRGF